MKGALLMEGEKYFTNMKRMLTGIKNVESYNWLITDFYGEPNSAKLENLLSQEYVFLTGEELLKVVGGEPFQWMWAVLTAFKPEVELNDILQYMLPIADGYDGFWEDRITMQHPKAEMELVAYDSSMFIMIAKSYTRVKYFREVFPKAVDLREYNLSNR